MTWYRSVTKRFIGHDEALRDYLCNLVHRLRRAFIEDRYEQCLSALDEGIKILDEDERQRSTLWNDGIAVRPKIHDETFEQKEEEDDQGRSNRRVRRRTTQTKTMGESSRCPHPPRLSRRTKTTAESSRRSPLPHPSRLRARRTKTVGESNQRSSPPRPSSHGYIPTLSPMQPEAHMFVRRPPTMNLPPYHFDPYAPMPSSSYMDHGMPKHSMYGSLPQYMSSPFTLPCYNYSMPYSGDDSFMNMLSMPCLMFL
ncbi:hypothetical protein Scep_026306 [Stephania cephalantha]|uniref:Uncharacterized protein n=1 Tax=Stephania cephalantha TaxID=152367 RepID=A0AAP0EN30_9MAGN